MRNLNFGSPRIAAEGGRRASLVGSPAAPCRTEDSPTCPRPARSPPGMCRPREPHASNRSAEKR